MNNQREKTINYLKTDLMRHLAHLKYMERYGDAVTCHYLEVDGEPGVLLSHLSNLSEWDLEFYPKVEAILLPTTSGSPKVIEALVTEAKHQYDTSASLAVKFCDPDVRDAFVRVFPLEFARSYGSYTMNYEGISQLDWSDRVVIGSVMDEQLSALYVLNGYSPVSLVHYFEAGGQSFTIYENETPICSCMTFHNFGAVWEIGGVHTIEMERGKGYGKQVVAAALATLLTDGRISRYQVSTANIPSVRLAESLGMTRCLVFEHYVTFSQNK
ncbi:MAG TPA: GNAT family N-acetyltransferase [Phototrophicaceae bacterium]|jgi:hypothetical protein|nr:GNAT family N-acetyltransferase [Phototrophicaceae bacterium]